MASKAKQTKEKGEPKSRKGIGGRPSKATDEEIFNAILDSNGLLSDAARLLNVSVSMISKRVKASELLQEARQEAGENMLDTAENKLMKLVKNEEHTDHFKSLCFFLKCKGKSRGYVEKQIIFNGEDDRPLPFNREKPPNA